MTVTGPDGSVTVQVIDQCPDCAAGHIDLSEPAFAKLAPLGAGLINVHYQYLADPPLPGPVTMEVKSGSSQYWLALLADNTGNPLASVQVETASGGWVSLARASYNYWIAQSGAGAGPFTVRLTDTEGNQVTVHNVALDPGAVQSTGVYMYGAGSDPATPAAASASTAASPTARATHSAAPARASSSVSSAQRPAPRGGRRRPRPSRRLPRRSRPPLADHPHRGPHSKKRVTLNPTVEFKGRRDADDNGMKMSVQLIGSDLEFKCSQSNSNAPSVRTARCSACSFGSSPPRAAGVTSAAGRLV